MTKRFAAACLLVSLVLSPLANAAQIYRVLDHGFGTLNHLGPYGVRLDILPGAPNTFSVEQGGANVMLTYDAALGTATFTGSVFSHNASMPGLFGIEYSLTNLISRADGGFLGDANPATTTSGRLFNLGDDSTILSFEAKSNMANPPYHSLLAFDGHRIPGDQTTGVFRGWVVNENRPCCNDFLVRVESVPVPVPPTSALIVGGLALLGLRHLRSRRS